MPLPPPWDSARDKVEDYLRDLIGFLGTHAPHCPLPAWDPCQIADEAVLLAISHYTGPDPASRTGAWLSTLREAKRILAREACEWNFFPNLEKPVDPWVQVLGWCLAFEEAHHLSLESSETLNTLMGPSCDLSPRLKAFFYIRLMQVGLSPAGANQWADELVQDTWAELWVAVHKGRYDCGRPFVGYLFGIANKLLMKALAAIRNGFQPPPPGGGPVAGGPNQGFSILKDLARKLIEALRVLAPQSSKVFQASETDCKRYRAGVGWCLGFKIRPFSPVVGVAPSGATGYSGEARDRLARLLAERRPGYCNLTLGQAQAFLDVVHYIEGLRAYWSNVFPTLSSDGSYPPSGASPSQKKDVLASLAELGCANQDAFRVFIVQTTGLDDQTAEELLGIPVCRIPSLRSTGTDSMVSHLTHTIKPGWRQPDADKALQYIVTYGLDRYLQ